MANKLELTWYGKDKPIAVEPRLLVENAALSNCVHDPDKEYFHVTVYRLK